MVVLGVSGRMCGRFFAGGVERGVIRIRERGYSTVVFVAGGGIVEGAFAEAGGEVTEELVGVSFGLAAAAALGAGDGGKEVARFGVVSEELEEALLLAGGAAVLEGVEVAFGRAGVGAGAATRHYDPPLLATDPPEADTLAQTEHRLRVQCRAGTGEGEGGCGRGATGAS